MDFIALNTINAIETTKATNNTNMLKQPTGTNHVQFRFHQFGLGARGIGGGFCSMEFFYVSREAFCNHSLYLALRPRLDGSGQCQAELTP
ncbi:MAG: hypothetical protein DMF36_05405 [Verrucomicrobia bacterium]|nr:MAG: hypothetical protein DMF36_05405 [Verrucomicrobiota bacterium]